MGARAPQWYGQHPPLALEELLLFPVQLRRLRNDVLLLLSETLINGTLLALLLEKAHGLQGPLALHDEGPDTS